MIRTSAINYLIKSRGYKSYLEIGLSWPHFNYNKIKCEHKESCDPYFPSTRDSLATRDNLPDEIKEALTYLMTSDEMFDAMPEDKKYDIILIDGLHTEGQCCKDIANSMAHLNPGGVILVHDTIPANKKSQEEDSDELLWVGTVWKSVVKLNNTNITFHTIKEDVGLTIIDYNPTPDFTGYFEPSGYEFEDDFSTNVVHLITDREFRDMYRPMGLFKTGEPLNLIVYIDIDENSRTLSHSLKTHFHCIEYYKNLFSSVTFILGVDKDCDAAIENIYRDKIFSIGFNCNIAIKLIKKNIFGGGSVFYTEIANKLNELNGLTAFINCEKGSISDEKRVMDSDIKRIISSYYQMFEDPDFVRFALLKKQNGVCYGAFAFFGDSVPTKNKWYYYGGFQWINTKKLYKYMEENNISLPNLESKTFDEEFLPSILPMDYSLISSWDDRYITSDISIMNENSNSSSVFILEENDSYFTYDCFVEDVYNILCIPLND